MFMFITLAFGIATQAVYCRPNSYKIQKYLQYAATQKTVSEHNTEQKFEEKKN